jgi:hypothetical protein
LSGSRFFRLLGVTELMTFGWPITEGKFKRYEEKDEISDRPVGKKSSLSCICPFGVGPFSQPREPGYYPPL